MFSGLFRVISKAFIANPLGLFVYGIMSKWYIMIMLAAVMITFWVFKGLEKSGILTVAEKTISQALMECKSVAQNCTPLIMNLPAMWSCIQNPPEYVVIDTETKLDNQASAAEGYGGE